MLGLRLEVSMLSVPQTKGNTQHYQPGWLRLLWNVKLMFWDFHPPLYFSSPVKWRKLLLYEMLFVTSPFNMCGVCCCLYFVGYSPSPFFPTSMKYVSMTCYSLTSRGRGCVEEHNFYNWSWCVVLMCSFIVFISAHIVSSGHNMIESCSGLEYLFPP